MPQDQSRRLFDAAQEPKRLVLIRGANHNDFELLTGGPLPSMKSRGLWATC